MYMYEYCLCSAHVQINDVFVGNTRDALLDRADPDLCLVPVVAQFGKFLKIIIALDDDTDGNGRMDITARSDEEGPNAFAVMRQAMREQSRAKTPFTHSRV